MQARAAYREPEVETQFSDIRISTPATLLEFPPIEIAADESASVSVFEDMHPGIYKIAVASWAVFIGIFWLTFWPSANALFMVAVSTVYACVFFGVPFVMSRCVPNAMMRDHGLIHFLRSEVDTLYGPVNGLEALAQVIMVPVALSVGGIAIAFAIHSARLAN